VTALSGARVRAVLVKEFRQYRRNKFILYTMVVLPVLFLVAPITTILGLPATAPEVRVHAAVGSIFLLMLLVPVIVPAAISAYSVIGERDQGTLEPVLTTPIRREEFVLGKALASIIPGVALSYLLFVVIMTVLRLVGHPNVVHALWQVPWLVAEVLFAPLLAAWSTWIGTAISARSSDVRVAQQLGTLASLPALAVTSLMTFQVLSPTVPVALIVAGVLVVIDVAALRVVSNLFDRERLITGARATRPHDA
jgi:ABC-2 type transport system permease protein